ncbi:hypothetical protein I4U23_007499 [Adineta vaga]|nr:hypothetical protein I4U23_007499 [Adineta vaga]
MNETVDSVYRFVTDQSSTAYSKMNSFVSSLRRRLDKVLTATASPNSSPTHSSSFSTKDDEYYSSSSKYDQQRKREKNLNVYDTLSKHRPLARSNPNVQNSNKNLEASKPVHIQRHSLRSSMRPSTDSQTPHIYESLDTPSPEITPPVDLSSSSAPEQSYTSTSSPAIIKSSYLLPSSIVVLDHFTTNLYLVVNSTLNQLLVVFGSTKIHTIKLYDTNGRKIHNNDLILQYKFEDLHGYKLLSSALNNSSENRLIVNEIRVYVTESLNETSSNQTLKQRLLFFDQNGNYMSASKRLPITNELLFVDVDRLSPSIYAYDGLNLINLDRNWSTNVENIDCIAAGSTFLVCLHTKTNQISIYNNQTGSFIYRWLITTHNIRHLQTVYLCVSRQDFIYVLVWNCDVHPVNNLVLVFDQEGQLRREYYTPNRIIPNMHGAYTYDMTLGGGSGGGGHQTGNPFGNLMRRSTSKAVPQTMAWMQQQQQQQQAMWNPSGRHHPHMWPANSPAHQRAQMQPMYHRDMASPYDMYHHSQQQQPQQHEDNTLFHARFIAITDDDTLILSNIIDLGLDEETQEKAVVNVSRKILFFHIEP